MIEKLSSCGAGGYNFHCSAFFNFETFEKLFDPKAFVFVFASSLFRFFLRSRARWKATTRRGGCRGRGCSTVPRKTCKGQNEEAFNFSLFVPPTIPGFFCMTACSMELQLLKMHNEHNNNLEPLLPGISSVWSSKPRAEGKIWKGFPTLPPQLLLHRTDRPLLTFTAQPTAAGPPPPPPSPPPSFSFWPFWGSRKSWEVSGMTQPR